MKINWAAPLAFIAGLVMLWLLLGRTSTPSMTTPSPTATVRSSMEMREDHSNEHDHNEGINQEDENAELPTTPTYDGGENPEFTHSDSDQQAAVDVTTRFIAGWLNPDPTERRVALEPIAAKNLVAQLSTPDIRFWHATVYGSPTLINQSSTAVMSQQTFSDGRAVKLLLLYDPTIETRWTVIDIQPVKES